MEQLTKLKFTEYIYFEGDFNGKYSGIPIKSQDHLSSIDLLESNIFNTKRCGKYVFFNTKNDNLHFEMFENICIEINDENLTKKIRFKEDVCNLKIDNIKLSNQMIDGKKTFGQIQGKAKFSIPIQREIDFNKSFNKLPKADFDIFIPELEAVLKKKNTELYKKKIRQKIIKFLKYFPLIIYLIVMSIASIYFISNFDFDKKINSTENFITNKYDEIINSINSKTIYLRKKGNQLYLQVEIANTKNELLVDTGASMTLIPEIFLNKLIADKYLKPEIHLLGFQKFKIANGESVEGSVWRVPRLKLGSEILYDVEVSSLPGAKTGLLGMSTLEKLGNYSIFPNENKIVIFKN